MLGGDIDVKMRGIEPANIPDGLEVGNVVEVMQFGWILEAARQISDGAPGVIERHKETLSVLLGISAKPALPESASLLRAAKILLGTRFEKNGIDFGKMCLEGDHAVGLLNFHDFPLQAASTNE